MKTKEDILKEKAGIYQFTNGWTFEDDQKLIKAIHEAMEEYAYQFRLFAVSGSLPCHHNYIQKDTYWKSCTHCGMLAPLGQ